jgi:hypothetical protein
MRILKTSISFLMLATGLSGCAAWLDPFEYSDEAAMASVAMKVALGEELDGWLSSAAGKKVVLVNMEAAGHTDDQAPEYMLHDALVSRLANAKAETILLERDADLLAIMDDERSGGVSYKVASETPAGGPTLEERRKEVGAMLSRVLDQISPQDSMLIMSAPCCDNAASGKVLETVAANEVGGTKSALIKELVQQYADLYKVTPGGPAKAESSPSVAGADYLFAYRIYDFGTWSIKTTRIAYIKAHIRVVDMKTGQIVASDFIEKRLEDELNTSQRLNLINTKASQADYGRPASRTSDSGTGGKTPFSAPAGKGK